jgi:hypothetical protein
MPGRRGHTLRRLGRRRCDRWLAMATCRRGEVREVRRAWGTTWRRWTRRRLSRRLCDRGLPVSSCGGNQVREVRWPWWTTRCGHHWRRLRRLLASLGRSPRIGRRRARRRLLGDLGAPVKTARRRGKRLEVWRDRRTRSHCTRRRCGSVWRRRGRCCSGRRHLRWTWTDPRLLQRLMRNGKRGSGHSVRAGKYPCGHYRSRAAVGKLLICNLRRWVGRSLRPCNRRYLGDCGCADIGYIDAADICWVAGIARPINLARRQREPADRRPGVGWR